MNEFEESSDLVREATNELHQILEEFPTLSSVLVFASKQDLCEKPALKALRAGMIDMT